MGVTAKFGATFFIHCRLFLRIEQPLLLQRSLLGFSLERGLRTMKKRYLAGFLVQDTRSPYTPTHVSWMDYDTWS